MRNSVCYFGSYDPTYARNRIIKKGLISKRIKVLECRASGIVWKRYFKLFKCFMKRKNNFQVIIVGFPGHYDVPLAFLLGKIFKKKVLFDVFASTYETYVLDRKVIKSKSLRAKFFFILDWIGMRLADILIVDTKTHADFYSNLYKIKEQKQIVVYVGSDNDYFYPRKLKTETDVLFYGSYQPLQGVEYIVQAASMIPNVKFRLVGQGQQKKKVENLSQDLKLNNIEFLDWIQLKNLAQQMSKAKIILGVFGKGIKAQIVIPNKVYDAIASKKALITSDTAATREVFSNNINVFLVPSANAHKLATAIKQILQNNKQRNSLENAAFDLYKKNYQPDKIVRNLIQFIS